MGTYDCSGDVEVVMGGGHGGHEEILTKTLGKYEVKTIASAW